MRSSWRNLLAVGGSFAAASPAAAQRGTELGVQAVATASDPALVVAGASGAVRTSTRTRVCLGVGAGVAQGEFAARGELLGHFMLSPGQTRGAGFYLAGGLAVVGGTVSRQYLVLTAGLEHRPGSASGWSAELGVGGGVRLGLGYRWRWLRRTYP